MVVGSMRLLTNCESLSELGRRILEEVARNMDADGGSVYLLEDDKLVLHHALDPGHADPVIPLPLKANSVFERALATGRPCVISNIADSPDLAPSGWSGYGDRSILAFPMIGDDGRCIGVLSLHAKEDPPFTPQDRDIGLILISFAYETIRAVAALEGLATSEERFRSLVEASPIGIQGVDLSGRLISVNRAALELHGARDESAILGRSFLDSVAPADRDRVAKMMNRARENSIFDMEFDAILDGGRHTLAAWFTPLIGGDGAVREIIALTQDVTDRKQTEEQLRQAQKMDVVGQLTGGIAHDFNNILAIILGNIELLGEQVSGNAEIEHFVETLERTTRRGAELTQRLLAFSRRQPLDPQDIDITRLVDGMTSMLRRTLGETVGIETDWDPDVWHIHADAGQMENALVNLAINARDAMPDGGMLTFAIANATRDAVPDFVDAGEDGEDGDIDYVRVMVRDTGTGMSADVLQHVFEPFFTTKDVGKGSGLGLSMVYGFVRQSNGRVRIESSEGQGTAVTLFMPRAAPRTQSMSPPGGGRRVHGARRNCSGPGGRPGRARPDGHLSACVWISDTGGRRRRRGRGHYWAAARRST